MKAVFIQSSQSQWCGEDVWFGEHLGGRSMVGESGVDESRCMDVCGCSKSTIPNCATGMPRVNWLRHPSATLKFFTARTF